MELGRKHPEQEKPDLETQMHQIFIYVWIAFKLIVIRLQSIKS